MEQLSGADNLSIIAEKGNNYSHVSLLMLYDQSSAPGGMVRLKDVMKHFEHRLYLHPVFRKRLSPVPLGLDRPYWIAEGEIDIEFHVRHIALPYPGDWRQLSIQIARLHSRPLDRAHPLWEAYVIEGLNNIPGVPDGAFAIYLKLHHAVVDGMAAVQLLTALHDSTPEGTGTALATTSVFIDRSPLAAEIALRALGNGASRLLRAARLGMTTGSRLLANVRNGRNGRGGDSMVPPAPHTRFSGRVSPNRVMDGLGISLAEIKQLRAQVPGITLNDVFLGVAGGGVRRYLASKGELPETSLNALMPISLRSDASAGGNDVAGVPVQVRSDIADPIERLHAVHASAAASKASAEKMGLDLLKNLFEVLPGFATNLVVNKLMIPRLNMTVSNVRGPDQPIYLAGARALTMFPVSIPADGAGLNLTGISYNGTMWISVVSCRNMLPDPARFIECMSAEWEAMKAAATKLSGKAAPAKPTARTAARTPAQKASNLTTLRKPAAAAKVAVKSPAKSAPARRRRSAPV